MYKLFHIAPKDADGERIEARAEPRHESAIIYLDIGLALVVK